MTTSTHWHIKQHWPLQRQQHSHSRQGCYFVETTTATSASQLKSQNRDLPFRNRQSSYYFLNICRILFLSFYLLFNFHSLFFFRYPLTHFILLCLVSSSASCHSDTNQVATTTLGRPMSTCQPRASTINCSEPCLKQIVRHSLYQAQLRHRVEFIHKLQSTSAAGPERVRSKLLHNYYNGAHICMHTHTHTHTCNIFSMCVLLFVAVEQA